MLETQIRPNTYEAHVVGALLPKPTSLPACVAAVEWSGPKPISLYFIYAMRPDGQLKTLEEIHIDMAKVALELCGGDVLEASHSLDIGRSTFYRKFAEFLAQPGFAEQTDKQSAPVAIAMVGSQRPIFPQFIYTMKPDGEAKTLKTLAEIDMEVAKARLELFRGDISKTVRSLKIGRTTFYTKFPKLGC